MKLYKIHTNSKKIAKVKCYAKRPFLAIMTLMPWCCSVGTLLSWSLMILIYDEGTLGGGSWKPKPAK